MYSSKVCRMPRGDINVGRHRKMVEMGLRAAPFALALLCLSTWGCYTILTHPRVGRHAATQTLPPDSVATADLEEERVEVHGDCLQCHTGRHVAAYYNDPFYDGQAGYAADDPWLVPRRAGTYSPYYDRWRSYSSYPWWLSRESDYYGSSSLGRGWYYHPSGAAAFSAAQKDSTDTAGMRLQERDRRWERLSRLPTGGFRLPVVTTSPSQGGTVATKRDSVQSSSSSPSSETPSKPAAEDEKTKEEKRSDKRKAWRKGKGLD